MGRPRKNNAEYFTHDSGMRNDVKIRALRRKHKHMGYAVWNYLLEALTDSADFRIKWDEVNIDLYSADFDVTQEELADVVQYCIKIDLLKIDPEGYIYSETLCERFNGARTANLHPDRKIPPIRGISRSFSEFPSAKTPKKTRKLRKTHRKLRKTYKKAMKPYRKKE